MTVKVLIDRIIVGTFKPPLKDVFEQDVKTSGIVIFAKSKKLYPEVKPYLPIDYVKQINLLISVKDISMCTRLLSEWSTLVKRPISIVPFHY